MFDIGWTEITIILIVAIIVIGPKELPGVLRTVGQWVGKAKSMTNEFRGHIDEMIQDTELSEVKQQIDSVGSLNANTVLENAIDADGDIKDAFDFSGDEFSSPVDLDDHSYDDKPKEGTIEENGSSEERSQELSNGTLEEVSGENPNKPMKETKT